MSETLYRKYRPKTFAELCEQGHVKNALQNQLRGQTLAHSYLFSGPRGVGKTTIARLLAKAANCGKLADGEPCLKCESCQQIERGATMDVFEIDAASHTGVDHVREMIIDNVRFAPSQLKMKVFIIDEVHMLSTSAFNALLKTLEEPPVYALFILATTELHKVPETIISRCQRFDFHRMPQEAIVKRLGTLVKAEKAKVEKEVLETIARRSEGCLRDAESLLGQVLAVDDPSLVLPPSCGQYVCAYLKAVVNENSAEAIKIINDAMERGIRIEPFMDEVLAQLRHLILRSMNCILFDAPFDPFVEKGLDELAHQHSAHRFSELTRVFLNDRDLFARDQFPQMALEVFAARSAISSSLPRPAEHSTTPARTTDVIAHQNDSPASPKAHTKIKTTLSEVRDKWYECCRGLHEQSGTLPLVLQNAQVARLDGAELHLHFPFQFHASQINDLKNKQLIEGALTKVFGEPIYIVADYVPMDTDAVMTELIAEFGGSAA